MSSRKTLPSVQTVKQKSKKESPVRESRFKQMVQKRREQSGSLAATMANVATKALEKENKAKSLEAVKRENDLLKLENEGLKKILGTVRNALKRGCRYLPNSLSLHESLASKSMKKIVKEEDEPPTGSKELKKTPSSSSLSSSLSSSPGSLRPPSITQIDTASTQTRAPSPIPALEYEGIGVTLGKMVDGLIDAISRRETVEMTLHLEELETRVTQLNAICCHLHRQNGRLKETLGLLKDVPAKATEASETNYRSRWTQDMEEMEEFTAYFLKGPRKARQIEADALTKILQRLPLPHADVLDPVDSITEKILLKDLPLEVALCLEEEMNKRCNAKKDQPGHGSMMWELVGAQLGVPEETLKKWKTWKTENAAHLVLIEWCRIAPESATVDLFIRLLFNTGVIDAKRIGAKLVRGLNVSPA